MKTLYTADIRSEGKQDCKYLLRTEVLDVFWIPRESEVVEVYRRYCKYILTEYDSGLQNCTVRIPNRYVPKSSPIICEIWNASNADSGNQTDKGRRSSGKYMRLSPGSIKGCSTHNFAMLGGSGGGKEGADISIRMVWGWISLSYRRIASTRNTRNLSRGRYTGESSEKLADYKA